MSARKVRPGSVTESQELNDRSSFVGMFDTHAAHVYDYCLSLLGDETEAASASRVTLIAAYMLGGRMSEQNRLRAWMLALARRECLSESPTRDESWFLAGRPRPAQIATSFNGGSLADAETSQLSSIGLDTEAIRAVRLGPRITLRTDPYVEVLDLVRRHGIALAELPAILDISADDAQALMTAAPVMTSLHSSRGNTESARPRDLGAPLASLPGSIWRDTARIVFDADQGPFCQAVAADAGRLWSDGFAPEPAATVPPSRKKLAITSVGMAAALLAPAAVGAGLYAFYAVSPHTATRSHDQAISKPAPASHSTSANQPTSATTRARLHSSKARPSGSMHLSTTATSVIPVHSTRPTTGPTTHKSTSPPPVIKPDPSKDPSPSPTSPKPTSPSPTGGGSSSPPPTPSSSLPDPSPTSPSPSPST